MASDPRFGLPLSLVEALRRDTSPRAAELADLLEQEPAPVRRRSWSKRSAVVAGMAATLAGLSSTAMAADAGMVGRWVMAPQASSFHEALTGAKPDKVVVVVTRDDRRGFDYQVEESRAGAPVARASYAVSYAGPSVSRTGGAVLRVNGARASNGDVVIRAPEVDGLQAVIRVHRDGPGAAVIEHAVEGASGSTPLERLQLARETLVTAG